MTENSPEATPKTEYIQRSATVGLDNTCIDDITDAMTAVGAPNDSRIQTNFGFMADPGNGSMTHPFSVTFTWFEEK